MILSKTLIKDDLFIDVKKNFFKIDLLKDYALNYTKLYKNGNEYYLFGAEIINNALYIYLKEIDGMYTIILELIKNRI